MNKSLIIIDAVVTSAGDKFPGDKVTLPGGEADLLINRKAAKIDDTETSSNDGTHEQGLGEVEEPGGQEFAGDDDLGNDDDA